MPGRFVQALTISAACMAVSGALHAANFRVESLLNSGEGTLRDAIESANATDGADTIDFNPQLNGTIQLSSSLPPLSGELEITGPGTEIITVSGSFLYVFEK